MKWRNKLRLTTVAAERVRGFVGALIAVSRQAQTEKTCRKARQVEQRSSGACARCALSPANWIVFG
jgi:hypothetical protein